MSIRIPTYQEAYECMLHRGKFSSAPRLWEGLQGYWDMTLGKAGLRLLDFSGNRHHGTLTNGPTWGSGPMGTMLRFGGSDQANVVLMAGVPAFRTSDFTVFCIGSSDTGGDINPQLMGHAGAAGGGQWGLFTWGIDSSPYLRFLSYGNNINAAAPAASWTAGAHACVATRRSGVVTLYQDGLQVGVDATATYDLTSTASIQFGNANAWELSGDIHAGAIWTRALSASEIAQLHYRPRDMVTLRRTQVAVLDYAAPGGTTLTPSPVALLLTPPAATLRQTIHPSPVAVALTVPTAAVSQATILTPSPVAVALTPPAATLRQTLAPSPVALALTAAAATARQTLKPSPVALALTAPAATARQTLKPSPVVLALTAPTATLVIPNVLTPSPVALALTAPAATIRQTLTPSPVALALTAPAATARHTLTPSPVALALTAPAATARQTLTPSPVVIALTAPEITLPTAAPITLTPSPVAIALTAPAVKVLGTNGYAVYWDAGRGIAAGRGIDWTARIGFAPAGQATLDLTGLGLAADTDYWLGLRAVSAAAVEETGCLCTVRVRIDSEGNLVGPAPGPLAWAKAEALAEGYIRVSAAYPNVDAARYAAAETIQFAALDAVGEPDWGTILATLTVTGSASRRTTLAVPYADGETVRLAARALAGSVAGPATILRPVAADASPPAAVASLTAVQAS